MKSYSSVLLDKETTEYVEKNDVAGLLSKIESEKATLLSSDIVGLRSKIISLARLIQPFTLGKDKNGNPKWIWKSGPDITKLENLADGIFSKDTVTSLKVLKAIVLGSLPMFDRVYEENNVNHAQPGDWSIVLGIGQSLNTMTRPFIDTDEINDVVSRYIRLMRGEETDADKKLLETQNIKGHTSQKRAQAYAMHVSKAVVNSKLEKKLAKILKGRK